jgi:putative two-component system response regulator
MQGRERTPVIFTSGKAGDRDLRRAAFEFDIYAYLEKPINPSEFLVYAMHIVDNQRQSRDMETRLKESSARAEASPPKSGGGDGGNAVAVIDAMLDVAALHDPTIIAHHNLAAQIAVVLGREAKLTAEEQKLLGQAARIYDIGKVGIPQALLESRTALDKPDRVTVERHADLGMRLLAGREDPILKAATVIAQSHHEHYDGSGYPRRLRGGQIPVMGRIVAVADTLAALLRDRPDRQAHTLAQAIEIVDKGSGSFFDPTIVNAIRPALNDISRIVHESTEKQAS